MAKYNTGRIEKIWLETQISDFLGLFWSNSDQFWLLWAKKSDYLTLIRLVWPHYLLCMTYFENFDFLHYEVRVIQMFWLDVMGRQNVYDFAFLGLFHTTSNSTFSMKQIPSAGKIEHCIFESFFSMQLRILMFLVERLQKFQIFGF